MGWSGWRCQAPAVAEKEVTMRSDGFSTEVAGWEWPPLDQPVELSRYVLREWQHTGDSPMLSARPRKTRGAKEPLPAWLIKEGRDAVGERLYALAACHFQLPSAVVRWTPHPRKLQAAIRFEPDAWRPRQIDPERGLAFAEDEGTPLDNPQDYYRHLALSDLLGEYDGAEFMVSGSTLFRIDAASTGWACVAQALSQYLYPEEAVTRPPFLASAFQATVEGLARDSQEGLRCYLDACAQMAAWVELPERLAADMRTCPAAGSYPLPAVFGLLWPKAAPTMAQLADEIETFLRRQREVLMGLLEPR